MQYPAEARKFQERKISSPTQNRSGPVAFVHRATLFAIERALAGIQLRPSFHALLGNGQPYSCTIRAGIEREPPLNAAN